MTQLETSLRRAAADLASAGVPFAVVGGLAVSVRTEPRFTRDVDLAVIVATDAEAEALVANLRGRGYAIVAVLEQRAVGRLATARLQLEPGHQMPVVDLLFASSGIEPEIVESADVLEMLPGFRIPVARAAHLMAMKILSRDDVGRPQDVIDLRALLGVAAPGDLDQVRAALGLITKRGYDRGRDLLAEFSALTTP